jgi:hypothetical protein
MLDIIDQYGLINQQIKELEAIKAKFKAEIMARGVGTYEGAQFFAEVQHYDRSTINPELVRKLADKELVAKVTETKSVDALVVKAL